jgi:hypothetical protein
MHLYKTFEGTPVYKVPYASKDGLRDATLADLRKSDGELVPSVTEILNLLDKPGLTNWKIDQAILAALTLPEIYDDGFVLGDDRELLKRIKADAKEQSRVAMQTGTDIHKVLEDYFSGRFLSGVDDQYLDVCRAVKKQIVELGIDPASLVCEKTFATNVYGGCCDAHNDQVVIDFKTSNSFVPGKKYGGYLEQHLQLVAYDVGLHGHCLLWSQTAARDLPHQILDNDFRRHINIFVSTNRSSFGHVGFHEFSVNDAPQRWATFRSLVQSFYLVKNLEL